MFAQPYILQFNLLTNKETYILQYIRHLNANPCHFKVEFRDPAMKSLVWFSGCLKYLTLGRGIMALSRRMERGEEGYLMDGDTGIVTVRGEREGGEL